jgi:hypothetical protein
MHVVSFYSEEGPLPLSSGCVVTAHDGHRGTFFRLGSPSRR